MAAALGLDLRPGDVLVSIGTSGVASTVSRAPIADGTGVVTGFADATGGFLPMVTTMNAAGILDLQARWLGVDHDELAALALEAPAGSNGVTLLPYYGGERTPNRPDAVGTWTGLTPRTTRADLARAAFEALLCSLADAVDALLATAGDRAPPGPARRRRRPQPSRPGPGPRDPRPSRPAPAAGGVRRPRRRPAGRVGALRRARAAGVAAARHRDARGRPDPRRTRALRRPPRPPRTTNH